MNGTMAASGHSGHSRNASECLLSGVKRTSRGHAEMSANDPKRTLLFPKLFNAEVDGR